MDCSVGIRCSEGQARSSGRAVPKEPKFSFGPRN